MKSCELNYLKIGFLKISFEGKEKKHVDFENEHRRVAMHGHVGVGLGMPLRPHCWCTIFSNNSM